MQLRSSFYKIIRWIFIFCNILAFAIGVAIVAIGVYLHNDKGDYINTLPMLDKFNITGVVISLGIVLTFVSIIGFCGFWMESQCVLVMFLACMIIMLSMEIAVGTICFVYRNDIDSKLAEELKKGLLEENRHQSWDVIQDKLSCCGVYQYADWYVVMPERVPDSCCLYEGCGRRPASAFDKGCYNAVKSALVDNYYVLGTAGVTSGLVQIVLIVTAVMAVCSVRHWHGSRV